MAQTLSLSSTVSVLPCPVCKQTINTSMQTCPFCSASIDHAAATASADAFARVNQAISDASYLKIMAATAGTFFLLRLVPFLGLLGLLGFWFLLIATPVWAIRWFVKFGALVTDDPEFLRARRTARLVGIGAAVIVLLVAAATIILNL